MKSTSVAIATLVAGAVFWLAACKADDGTGCADAAPVDGGGDGEGGRVSQDAAFGDSARNDASVADAFATDASLVPDRAVGDEPSPSAATDAMDAASSVGDGAGNADATGMTAASSDATTTTLPATYVAAVRLANWSPDAPAVDFCLAIHGSGVFQGPILGQLAVREAEAGTCEASGVGIAFAQVSSYALVKPGQYDVKMVAAGVRDCSLGVADGTALPLDGNAFETIALLGDVNKVGASPGLMIAAFLDDQNPGGNVAVRFIHAAPGVGAVDLASVEDAIVISGGTPMSVTRRAVLFSSVPFGNAGASPSDAAAADSRGYFSRSSMSDVLLHAFPHAAMAPGPSVPDIATANVSAAAGSVLTMVLVGIGGGAFGADSGASAQLLECVDNAGTLCSLSNCAIITK